MNVNPRLIAAAPFRDRVVHHAIMNIIESPLDRWFIFDSYACRQHKGVRRAVDRYQQWARCLKSISRVIFHQLIMHCYYKMIFPTHRRLRNDNGYRFIRKLRQYAEAYANYQMDWQDIHPRVHSWIGHARHGDTHGLRRQLFCATVFRRGVGQRTSGVARRFLEQQTEERALG